MPFFVAVHQEVQPESLEAYFENIRGDFATSRRVHPGRRGTRIFQRLTLPHHVLAVGEWDSQADYEALLRSPRYQEMTVRADPPARIEYLTRLRLFARMSASAAIVGSSTIATSAERAQALEAFILVEVSRGIEASDGLVSHEVFRVGAGTGRLLVVHSWRSIEHLERFRTGVRLTFDAPLHDLGVTIERLTGVVAAQFSRHDL